MTDKNDENSLVNGTVKSVSVTPFLTALLKPTAEYFGIKLRDYVKDTVEDWQARRRESNIKLHVERVRAKLDEDPLDCKLPTSSFSQLSFFSEWLDKVQDVDPDDHLLSEMWQNLLVSAVRGLDIKHEILTALKTLSPREAQFLAYQRRRIMTSFFNSITVTSEDRYLAKGLEERRIVEKDYSVAGFSFLALMLASVLLYSFSEVRDTELDQLMWTVPIGLAALVILFMMRSGFVRWRLTWLGHQMLSYLPAADKIFTDNQQDVDDADLPN